MCNRTKGSGCAGAGIPVRVQTCSLFIGRVGRGMAGDDAMGRSWRMSSRYMVKNLIQNKPTRRDCRAAPHRNYLQTSLEHNVVPHPSCRPVGCGVALWRGRRGPGGNLPSLGIRGGRGRFSAPQAHVICHTAVFSVVVLV